ncbi:MAG: hypothetical protein IJH28_06420 [Mogibacterium sp.]|nr:hypothetical protein [Mogibacterium sp.]
MTSVTVVILSTALLLAMVLNLALKPSFSARLTTVCMIIAFIGGVIIYGVGFAESTGDIGLSMIRTPFCVIKMFVGINDYASIEGTSPVATPFRLVVFWIIHLLAFYSMASAAMFTLGEEALRYLRMLLAAKGDLTLIYSINDRSIDLGKECLEAGAGSVVFIADDADHSTVTDLNNMGMSVICGPSAVSSDKSVMRRLRAGHRKINVFAMDDEEDRDLFYALGLKDALEEAGVAPENTSITLPGAEDIITSMLQVSEDQYGFGYVNVYDNATLAARALIRTCPPWQLVRFGSDGRAQEDFDSAIVGFGRHGQAVLKQLIMNGQFAGSTFHAAVFSPNFENESGYMRAECSSLFDNYDIKSFKADGRSVEFYNYIDEHIGTLKLIAVCTGNEEIDREISDNLMMYLKRRKAQHICVVRCGKEGVRYQETVGSPIITANIYSLDYLSAQKADHDAIMINSSYDGSDRTDWEKWVACDPFSKMSSRASADFLPAFIKASGIPADEVAAGKWPPARDILEVLGETEHLRWNAFHYVMGYSPMSSEDFDERTKTYKKLREKGLTGMKLTKDSEKRTHACLIPWEELDSLSKKESSVTGREVDYKQYDINNVIIISEILKHRETRAI